jgi:hypothetical protein
MRHGLTAVMCALLVIGCRAEPGPHASAATAAPATPTAPTAAPTAAPTTAPAVVPPAPPPASPPTSPPTATCVGLAPGPCARTTGCILDQATYHALFCRPAEGRCEAAVRHADLIGADADPAVTPAATAAAIARCEATTGCAATHGRCSCPCALLGNCDCGCGGSFLARCVAKDEQAVYEGRPPAEHVPGPLGPWGDALVLVRRATGDHAVRVDPLPATAALVGKAFDEVENVLGTGTPCTGRAQPSAPCERDGQVFYSLYRLAAGSVGGGPELLLTFDDHRRCVTAVVRQTR